MVLSGRHVIAESGVKTPKINQIQIEFMFYPFYISRFCLYRLTLVSNLNIHDHGQATGKLYHLVAASRVHPVCNLQSRARTHAVLVIGLCELLGKPTT
jgi:hypothetical protein